MIPSLLILGAAVGGTQVKRVIGGILQSEGNAHKATGSRIRSSWGNRTGNLCLDDAVGELEALDDGVLPDAGLCLGLFLGRHILEPSHGLLRKGDPQPLLVLKHGWLGSHVVEAKAVESLQRIVLNLSQCAPGKQE